MSYRFIAGSGRGALFCLPGEDEKMDGNGTGGARQPAQGRRLPCNVHRACAGIFFSVINTLTLGSILVKKVLLKSTFFG